MSEFINQLNSFGSIFEELVNIKINQSNLFEYYNTKLSLIKDTWEKFTDIDKKLFKNKETYIKYLMLYKLDIAPNNFDSIPQLSKKFFQETQPLF